MSACIARAAARMGKAPPPRGPCRRQAVQWGHWGRRPARTGLGGAATAAPPAWRMDTAAWPGPSPRGFAARAGGKKAEGQRARRDQADVDDDDTDVDVNVDLEGEGEGEGGGLDGVGGLEGLPEDVEVGIHVDGVPWGGAVLEAATEALGAVEGEVALHGLSIRPSTSVVSVMVDHLTNRYGSPTMDEISAFTRALDARLEALVAEGVVPGDYTIEVSSPGADRRLRLPEELQRFADLPLDVTYAKPAAGGEGGDGAGLSRTTEVLVLKDPPAEGATVWTWKVADVRANRPQGKKLTTKMKKRDIVTTLDQLLEVRIHVDL